MMYTNPKTSFVSFRCISCEDNSDFCQSCSIERSAYDVGYKQALHGEDLKENAHSEYLQKIYSAGYEKGLSQLKKMA